MSATASAKADHKNLRRVVLSSLVGAVIEWYDFFLYGVVAGLVFNKLFFPEFSPGVGTILAFATFAVGFGGAPAGRDDLRTFRRQDRPQKMLNPHSANRRRHCGHRLHPLV